MSGLIERVESASGPDRELDCDICIAIGWFRTEPNKGWPDKVDYIDIRREEVRYPGHGFDQLVPRLTASLDAAMTLVPEGWRVFMLDASVIGRFRWSLRGPKVRMDDPECDDLKIMVPSCADGCAKLPALALCAAALKSRGLDQ